MKKTLLLLVAIVPVLIAEKSFAEPIEICRAELRQDIRDMLKKKFPNANDDQIEERLKEHGESITEKFNFAEGTQTCLIKKAKQSISQDKDKVVYCPRTKTKYKVDCFREWLSNQPASYTAELEATLQATSELAETDMAKFGKLDPYANALIVDTLLIAMEKMTILKNLAFHPVLKETAQLEQKNIQQVEREKFEKVKAEYLSLLNEKLEAAKNHMDSIPSSNANQIEGLKRTFKSYDKRIATQRAHELKDPVPAH